MELFDCCLRRSVYKNKFEMTYVGLSQVSYFEIWDYFFKNNFRRVMLKVFLIKQIDKLLNIADTEGDTLNK